MISPLAVRLLAGDVRPRRLVVPGLAERDGDPATIEVSVGIIIRDPQRLDANSPEAVVGRADHIAEAFAAWSEEGVTEAMCRLEPASVGVVETIADAAQKFRSVGRVG